jgi:hypothetical protein
MTAPFGTPFDATLRLRQREIDAVRVSITVEMDQLIAIDRSRDAIDRTVQHEARVVCEAGFSTYAFAARMRAQRERLSREGATVDARLSGLRSQAAEAYGALRAIEGAAGRYRDDAERTAAVAEQGRLDDFSAAHFTRIQQAARRARALEEPGSA